MRKLGWLVIFVLVGACDDDDDLDDLAGDSDDDGIPNDMEMMTTRRPTT